MLKRAGAPADAIAAAEAERIGLGDRGEVAATLGTAARLLVFITIPATVGLWILRVPIVHVLFERGEFTREDTLFTASALGWYGAGMLPVAAVSVLALVQERDGRANRRHCQINWA